MRLPHNNPVIIVNGVKYPHDALCLSANDRGLTLGHGLFETMRVSRGQIPLLKWHWQRLISSAALINLTLPVDLDELQLMIEELLAHNQLNSDDCGIRLTVTDGISARGLLSDGKQASTFILTSFPLPLNRPESITATIVKTRRNEHSFSSRVKSISYLDNILAKKEAQTQGYDEAILLNSNAHIAEGSISNLFLVKNQIIFTPPVSDGALPGVLRHVLLNDLDIGPLKIQQSSINLDMLFEADELFVSNALMGITSIKKVDQFLLPESFKVAKQLSATLEKQFGIS